MSIDLNRINFFVRSKSQLNYQSWPFDEAVQIKTILSSSVPRVNEYVNIKNENKDEETETVTVTYDLYRVAFVGYRITKGNIYEPCVLLE